MAAILALDIVCGIFSSAIIHYLAGTQTLSDDLRELGEDLAVSVEKEGIVLVKNDNDCLPLDKEEDSRVNVLGWSSTQWIASGSGYGQTRQYGGILGGSDEPQTSLLGALTAYGISYNTAITDAYTSFRSSRPFFYTGSQNCEPYEFYRLYEPDFDTFYNSSSGYAASLAVQAETYSSTAIVVLGRVSGDGADCPKVQYKGNIDSADPEAAADDTRTYLDISTEEEDLLTWAGDVFDKVVVIVNSANQMNLGFLDRIEGLDACMVVGYTGNNAATAIPEILYGDISPSGRLTDTYAYDFTTSPAYVNAGADGVTDYCYPSSAEQNPEDTDGTGTDGTDTDGTGSTNGQSGTDEENGSRENGSGANGSGENGSGENGSGGDGNTGSEDNTETAAKQYIEYCEGIYVGYKWYETADAEGFWDTTYAKARWGIQNGYDDVVQYPFGYGLSYTTFEWTSPAFHITQQSGDTTISVTVTVTNTGGAAGRDVVQLYCTPPYTAGGVEKASETLAAYGKTDLLEPGESEDVTLSFLLSDMVSYDSTASGGAGAYVLEDGTYIISLKTDAHTLKDCSQSTFQYIPGTKTVYSGSSNLFEGSDAVPGIADGLATLSRADFTHTFPEEKSETRAADENTATLGISTEEDIRNAFYAEPDGQDPGGQDTDKSTEQPSGQASSGSGNYADAIMPDAVYSLMCARYTGLSTGISTVFTTGITTEKSSILFQTSSIHSAATEDAQTQTGADGTEPGEDEDEGLLYDSSGNATETGLFFGNPDNYMDTAWEELLDNLTYEDMRGLVLHGFGHEISLSAIGKPDTINAYGASQIGSSIYTDPGVGYPSQTVLAQTWNKQLCGEYGVQLGKEASYMGYSGWYAPGAMVHRTPFSGSNYENSSEDSFLSGKTAGCIAAGSVAAGTTCYVQSLSAYAQETGKDGTHLWLTEQTLRETYLSPIYTAVQMGTNGIMTSSSCTGAVWTGGDKALISGIVRGEWGFDGTVISYKKDTQEDYTADQMLLAGGDILMNDFDWADYGEFTYLDDEMYEDSPLVLEALRACTKHILYTGLNTAYVNSIYNETHEDNVIVVYSTQNVSWWVWILVVINAVAVGSCAFWIYVAAKKKDRGDGYPVEELPPWLITPSDDPEAATDTGADAGAGAGNSTNT